MKKIVYIVEQFYLHGGIEKITAEKANFLDRKGYKITIISNNQGEKSPIYPLNDTINFIDLNINYNRSYSYFHGKNFLKFPKHILKLKKQLKAIDPDVVIDLSLQFDYYFLPFITKAKTIREFHNSRFYYEKTRTSNKSLLKKIKYKFSDFIESKYDYNCVLTPNELKYYRSTNVVVIPNGIILENSFDEESKSKTVLAAGRIAPVKNFEGLLRIWKNVSDRYPDWTLAIYGTGEATYISSLKKLAVQLNLPKKRYFCGITNALKLKMKEASIYAMTSFTECYPMVLLEAKSVGLPIISYDCPYGPQNIIQNNFDGLLVENQNESIFEEKLVLLIEDANLRQSITKNALQSIHKNTLEVIMQEWINLFER